MMRTILTIRSAIIVAALCLPACSGGGSTMSPSPGNGPVGAIVTITSSGVSPKAVTVNVGEVVTFVNNDTRSHDIESDPHPAHTDCPPINAVTTLAAGQSRNTGNLTTARTCGYHDHSDSGNVSLQGTITIR
jgi:plastocyanin